MLRRLRQLPGRPFLLLKFPRQLLRLLMLPQMKHQPLLFRLK